MISDLKELLRRHEGERLHPYTDTTGHITIGCGRNLSEKGISESELDFMLDNDITDAIRDAQGIFNNFWSFSEPRQMVILSMLFNLGKGGFLKFEKMIRAIKEGQWLLASSEMIDSLWARQVGIRAFELQEMMSRG